MNIKEYEEEYHKGFKHYYKKHNYFKLFPHVFNTLIIPSIKPILNLFLGIIILLTSFIWYFPVVVISYINIPKEIEQTKKAIKESMDRRYPNRKERI